MKTKISTIIIPPFAGFIAIFTNLIIYNLLIGKGLHFQASDIKFFGIFLPAAFLAALAFQFILTKMYGFISKNIRNIFIFSGTFIILSSLTFGFVFWERSLGTNELLALIFSGFIAATFYIAPNLFCLKQIEKKIEL